MSTDIKNAETPMQTAERVRRLHGVQLSEDAKKPLPRSAYDELWNDEGAPALSDEEFRSSNPPKTLDLG